MQDGKPDFYQLQKRTLATNLFKIKLVASHIPAAFVAYDILYLDGKLLAELPLMERKEVLAKMVTECQQFSVFRYIERNEKALFEMAKQQELEGVAETADMKDSDSLLYLKNRRNCAIILSEELYLLSNSKYEKSRFEVYVLA
ncbi:MAG: hypothetical protein HFG37_12515 [Eubacterium sp.]|nr:hypothetical protein [Eubacterium sp.]